MTTALSPSPSLSHSYRHPHPRSHGHSHPLSLSLAASVFRVPERTPGTAFALALALPLALALSTLSAPVAAADANPHQAHHPAGTASAPAAKGMSGKARNDMGPMDTHMKVMQEMHDKMMAAKTPEERNALMAEHMKAMQEGMGMMKGMGAVGANGGMGAVGANGGMGGMAGPKRPPINMSERQTMMEQRMDMMQTMMEMMVDRLPQTPAKP